MSHSSFKMHLNESQPAGVLDPSLQETVARRQEEVNAPRRKEVLLFICVYTCLCERTCTYDMCERTCMYVFIRINCYTEKWKVDFPVNKVAFHFLLGTQDGKQANIHFDSKSGYIHTMSDTVKCGVV